METSDLTRQILGNIGLIDKKLKDCEEKQKTIVQLRSDNTVQKQELQSVKAAVTTKQEALDKAETAKDLAEKKSADADAAARKAAADATEALKKAETEKAVAVQSAKNAAALEAGKLHEADLKAINEALTKLGVTGVSGGKSVHKRRKNKRKTLRRRNKKGKK